MKSVRSSDDTNSASNFTRFPILNYKKNNLSQSQSLENIDFNKIDKDNNRIAK